MNSYYLEDLKNNSYYDQLLKRLQDKYPQSQYSKQYELELASDYFSINHDKHPSYELPFWVMFFTLILSISLNIFLTFKIKRKKTSSSYQQKKLTHQEQKVLELILENKTNKEIASILFVSTSTIKTHINNLYKKLNVTSRNELKVLFYSNK